MQEKVSLYSYLTISILIFLGVVLLIALVSYLMQGNSSEILSLSALLAMAEKDPLYPLGAFFFMAFQWAAFLIPLFLLTNAFLLFIRPFPRLFLLLLNCLLIPFFTLALLIRLVTTDSAGHLPPLAAWVRLQFGQIGGTVLVLLLFCLELVLIYHVFQFLWRKTKHSQKTSAYVRRPSRLTRDAKHKRRDTNNYAFSAGGPQNAFTPNDPRLQSFRSRKPAAGNSVPPSPPAYPQPRLGKKLPDQSVRSGALPSQSPRLPREQEPRAQKPRKQEQEQEQQNLALSAPDLPAVPSEDFDQACLHKRGECVEDAVYEHVLPGIPEEAAEEGDETNLPAPGVRKLSPLSQGSEKLPEKEYQPAQAFDEPARELENPVQTAKESTIGRKKPLYRNYMVPEGLLKEYKDGEYWKIDKDTGRAGEVLMSTLLEFNITAELTGICKGPVITMFEILPSPGVKLSKIVNLADNIALRLAASSVRIVAPIPGKHAVGIEIPNKKRAVVSFKELISLPVFKKTKYEIPVVLGKDISGEAQIIDLAHTPHLLIAGATGSGKSVCVNSLIASILFKKTPEEIRLLLIDPKIVELKFFNDIPHLLTPVITEPKRSFQALQYCLCEMERRYSLLDSVGVRDISSYNRKIKEKKLATNPLPYIVIVIDEFADLMATTGKELESTIARLTAMSRAIGIHLVLATQRPSVDVITGLIKANIPSRIAFMVASKFDSRIIIDSIGAEKLLGKGDMLFTSAWNPFPIRIQGSFLTEEEVEAVTDHVKTLGEPDYIDDEIFYDDEEDSDYIPDGEADPLLEQAVEIILSANKASTSYLQRKLKIGYNRAARLIEDMEHRGIVGPPNGSKARDILHVPDRR